MGTITLTRTSPPVIELEPAEHVIELVDVDALKFKIFHAATSGIQRAGSQAVTAGDPVTVVFQFNGSNAPMPDEDYIVLCWLVDTDGTIGFVAVQDANRTADGFTIPEGLPVSGTLYHIAVRA